MPIKLENVGIAVRDLEAALARPWQRVLTPGIIASALSISLFLLSYYTAVAFFPIFFQTVQGFTADQANGLLNYYWASNAVSLIVAGALMMKELALSQIQMASRHCARSRITSASGCFGTMPLPTSE